MGVAEKAEIRPPARMYMKRVGKDGDRLRISFSDDLGGSYLVFVNFLRDLLEGKRAEVYSSFVPDSPEWMEKKKGR